MYFVYRDDVDVTERFVQTNQLYSYNNPAANASDAGVYTMFHESQGKSVNCHSLVIIAGNLAITCFKCVPRMFFRTERNIAGKVFGKVLSLKILVQSF